MTEKMRTYLQPTFIIDSDHSDVVEYAQKVIGDAKTDLEKGIRLYYAIRDNIRYNPYLVNLTPERLKASTTLRMGESFCVPKAILLAACARVVGIPSRLAFADVCNHLTSVRLEKSMNGKNIFVFHAQTVMYLNGKWTKSTPAFNLSLCEKINILPLEYDGTEDSIFHPFDRNGNKHMEYLKDRGQYDDFPYVKFIETIEEYYGKGYGSWKNEELSEKDSADLFESEAFAG